MAPNSSSAISVQLTRSSYRFKVENSGTRDLGISECVTSPSFTVGGYDWLIKYYPKGCSPESKDTEVALCLELLTSSNCVTVDYELGLLDTFGRPTTKYWIRSTQTFDNSKCSTKNWVIERAELESNYVKESHFFVVCSITIVNEPSTMVKSCLIGLSPSNLAEQLHSLFKRQEHTDVTFEVEGEKISAHKLVLGSRSPIFCADLFHPVANMNCESIKLDGIKPLIFKGILHFMYTDFLPNIDDILSSGGTSDMKMSPNMFYQLLIVAAEKFGLVGLRSLCEDRLCELVSVDTVISSLSLAEEHKYDHLKECCVEFIAEGSNFYKIGVTKEFSDLGMFYPSLLIELRKEFQKIKEKVAS